MEEDRAAIKQKLIHELGIRIDFNCLSYNQLLDVHSKLSLSKCTIKELALVLECEVDWLRKKIFNIKQESKKLRGQAKTDFLNNQLKYRSETAARPSTSTSTLENDIKKTVEETLRERIKELQEKETEQERKISYLEEKNHSLRTQKKIRDKSYDVLDKKFTKKQEVLKTTQRKQQFFIRSLRRKAIQQTHSKTLINEMKRKIVNYKKQVKQLESRNQCTEAILNTEREKVTVMDKDQKEMKMKIQNLNDYCKYCENQLKEEKTVQTFDSDVQSYTTDTQLCIMNLLSEGVGVHHVNNVISHVSELCGKTVSRLPSYATINRIGDQRASVSYSQINENLVNEQNTTLQSDETRKHGDVYEVFSVRDSQQKEWILGLKDMKDKSSDSCLNTLKTVIEDISHCTSSDCGKKILANIKNTMSDRAATEKKFHDLLESYRKEVLPSIYSNWNELSDDERESISSMNNFYCGLHIMVNFAELSDGIIKQFENSVKGDERLGAEAQPETHKFTEKGESGTVRLVRTAAKCLARGGDDKSGCYYTFKTFLSTKYGKDSKKVSNLLVPFRGNRFNILFYNSEIILYLADDIKEFFEKVHKPTNRLQKAVNYDINVDTYLAILKALGLCSKLVTAPFWRAMENKQCSLEDASQVYQKLFEFLEDAKDDSSEVLSGSSPLPDLVKKDEVYDRLTQPDSYDATTIVVLQQILGTWSTLLARAAADHLPGGKFADVNDTLATQTLSSPRHNKFPERVFALLDALTRFRPVASTLCNEAYIMFSLNKTRDWVNSLSDEKKKMYIDKARSEGREIRKKYKERIKVMEEAQREALKKKSAEIEKREQNKYRQREQLVNDMLYYGLWQYPEMVDQSLKGMSDTEQKKALKTQLQFRKVILEQAADKTLFQLSEKGKMYSTETLKTNVKTLIQNAIRQPGPANKNVLVGQRIVHYQIVDGIRTPFPGRVLSTVPGYPDWCNAIYDGDDSVYVYKLAEDYAAGDLEIVVEDLVEPPNKKRRQAEDSQPEKGIEN